MPIAKNGPERRDAERQDEIAADLQHFGSFGRLRTFMGRDIGLRGGKVNADFAAQPCGPAGA
ncbi:hypothetical protein [Chenggangzhangella methanolivorans]|uniref:Uncharacterized protein n=1 Tax=Chenggangzhangella methanolivorans TaxID=1437009 RepID=A0A9E6ULR0_9HYPH|nr:hypothetical protein [Chenggangzhangella methanolivorans]QZN98443.1 hypothetical protein K6K41_15325 [Chenggangzhangella methanolivorans]